MPNFSQSRSVPLAVVRPLRPQPRAVTVRSVGGESVVSGVQSLECCGDTDDLEERIAALSNDVSQAHIELNEERQKRRLLELENETLKLKVLSLTMMNPEAAAALEAAVDDGYDSGNSLDLSQIYLGSNASHHNRNRAMTAVESQQSLPMCRKATVDDAILAMEFENKEDVLVVRHIGSLGFGPAQTLAAYFSVFGRVQEVIEIEDRDEAIVVMAGGPGSTSFFPHGVKVVSGGEVEITSYDEALSAGWLSDAPTHDTDSRFSMSMNSSGRLGSSSPLYGWQVKTPRGSVTHQNSLRSHAQTWDASSSLPESSKATEAGEPPRMNLLEALQVFNAEDEKRVFTVRKVHKLGFKSQHALRQYFSQFGRVKDVVLLPMRAKPKPGPSGQVRGVRPSSMGFVVMQRPEDVQKILAYGGVHTIKGWPIEVRPFVRPSDKRDSKDSTPDDGSPKNNSSD
ncbi:hypothetical protein Pmar_PMAR006929 [Perkinsus marinus ATCC 50983]|uniref:RRM domain-containing protein n=1 Tax=Perkinsus marinus (strain ATCC 50983 / TXsc) TaxID=423536 RepID=C5KJU2_PERM5|nr:hypothetical protein Pmar_PMAR006929 [Perkinsus marinus ATCC 50983]EER15200.1 hypothetical protein Pmar_PMAR006929 [Perkinsus marinus ATCC 50983]|eukprot:XP_002783404.1 hypothetical protein Pmar_PMAR006929 [Perkinsus marinus ATCC 50983]